MHINKLDDLPYFIAVGVFAFIYAVQGSQQEIKNQTEKPRIRDVETQVDSMQLVNLTPAQFKTLAGIQNQIFIRENLATLPPVVGTNYPEIEPISAIEPAQMIKPASQVVPLRKPKPNIEKLATVEPLPSILESQIKPVSYKNIIAELEGSDAKNVRLDQLVTQVAWPSSQSAQIQVFKALYGCAGGRLVTINDMRSGSRSAERTIAELSKLRRPGESSLVRKIPSQVMTVLTQEGLSKDMSMNNSFMFFPNELDVMIKTKLDSLTRKSLGAQMFFEYQVSGGYLRMKSASNDGNDLKTGNHLVDICSV